MSSKPLHIESMLRVAFSKEELSRLSAQPRFQIEANQVSTLEQFDNLCEMGEELLRNGPEKTGS